MRMRFLILLLLIVSVCSYSLKYPHPSPEDHNSLLLRVLRKRSYGCSSGCASSCNSATSSSCSNCISNDCCNNCCQNQCNVCSTQACQSNTNCKQCCTISCSNATTTITPTTKPSVTTPCPTAGPTTSIPGVTYRPVVNSSNHSTSHSNTVKTNTYNRMGLSNSINIPINITNINVLRNIVSTSCNSGTSGKPCDDINTIKPTTTTTRPIIPTNPTPPSGGNGHCVIISTPGDKYPHLYPLENLPCYASGCSIRRPSWSGSLCSGWHGQSHGNLNLQNLDYGNWGSYGNVYQSTWNGGYPSGAWARTGYPSTWSGGYLNSWGGSGYQNTWSDTRVSNTGEYPSLWGGAGTWSGGYPWLSTGTSSWVGSRMEGYSNPWHGYGLGSHSIPWGGLTNTGLGGYTLPWTGISTSALGSQLGLSGCVNVNQDCSLCGSQFHNNYDRNSLAYKSCYGCFV